MKKTDTVAVILARLMNGMSENELARATSIPQPTIHRILTGESHEPKSKTLLPIASHFGITVAQLKGEEPIFRNGPELSPGPQLRQIPVLQWRDVVTWVKTMETHGEQMVSTSRSIGPRSFSVLVEGDAMAPNFPAGGRIDVDPDAQVNTTHYVVAIPEGGDFPVFRQYIEEGGKRLLAPVNSRYSVEICGEIIGRVMWYSLSL